MVDEGILLPNSVIILSIAFFVFFLSNFIILKMHSNSRMRLDGIVLLKYVDHFDVIITWWTNLG